MGANASSIDTKSDDQLAFLSVKSNLDDVPEACIALVLSYLDPPEISKLARVSRVFRAAASADFIWQPKLPSNYKYIFRELLGLKVDGLGLKDLYAKLSRPRSFDAGTKVCSFLLVSFYRIKNANFILSFFFSFEIWR